MSMKRIDIYVWSATAAGCVALAFFVFAYERSRSYSANVASSASAGVAAPQDIPTTLPLEALPDGMMVYKNQYYQFSLIYPKELAVQEYAENGGGRTIIFETSDMKTGFQIFIVPYSGTQVSKERFLMDQPSGVRKQPTDVIIDGTTASMFFGENMVMGETREVWFIKNGFLYEVTTYKPLDTWLGTIMQSWKFI